MNLPLFRITLEAISSKTRMCSFSVYTLPTFTLNITSKLIMFYILALHFYTFSTFQYLNMFSFKLHILSYASSLLCPHQIIVKALYTVLKKAQSTLPPFSTAFTALFQAVTINHATQLMSTPSFQAS